MRKPRDVKGDNYSASVEVATKDYCGRVFVRLGMDFFGVDDRYRTQKTLKKLKHLHGWLGKVIEYIEDNNKKKGATDGKQWN